MPRRVPLNGPARLLSMIFVATRSFELQLSLHFCRELDARIWLGAQRGRWVVSPFGTRTNRETML
jgi:hypothetical protein